MRFIVAAVPADGGGVLSILQDFYSYVKEYAKEDEWYFLVSTPVIKPCENIHVIRTDWTRRSWVHRLIWEKRDCPKVIRSINPDAILSLQNLTLVCSKIPQVVYVHQPLPFQEQKNFSFFKSDERKLAAYQNIIGRLINKSVKKADKVVVQTKWMKEAVAKKGKISINKIDILYPQIAHELFSLNDKMDINANDFEYPEFFYPAGPYLYKNHDIILDSLVLLKKRGLEPKVNFTLNGNENTYVKRLRERIKDKELNVSFVGKMDRKEVILTYRHSKLLFPSYIETFGLPLLEARLVGGKIIAARTPFASEILEGYGKVEWFEPFDSEHLANLMETSMKINKVTGEGIENSEILKRFIKGNSWSYLVNMLHKEGEKFGTKN